jgi:selenocysteine lyase/cysteine desulfurase
MPDRRKFLRQLGLTAGALSLPGIFDPLMASPGAKSLERVKRMTPEQAATDEEFWHWIRSQYSISPAIINLNNGGVSPQPKPVQEAHINFYKHCNEAPSFYMWRELDRGREPLRRQLAGLAGVLPDEVAINRNATEGLNTIIFGLNLKGIKLVWVSHELPVEDEETLARTYTSAFTDKTKIVHVTHIINWVGQIMPVRKIADEAHKRGIEVICDSAHSFAHFEYKIPDLGCDYWATSLHKWLGAPFGSGMMWIRKEKIKNIWALLSNSEPDGSDIRKFESLGTRSFASEMAISAAIDFHLLIGGKRKEARLRFLKDYWTQKAAAIPGVKINTPTRPEFACAIGHFSIDGVKPEEIDAILYDKYRLHTIHVKWENISGVRVTPNVYTSLADLDLLVEAIRGIAVEGK